VAVTDKKKPLRILHVLGELNFGGIEVMVMNLYRHINRRKIQFDFMVHTPVRCVFEDEIESLGGHVYRVPRFNGINIAGYVYSWKTFLTDHPEYRAVHGHIGSSAAIYLHLAKKAGIYAIAHSHGTKNEFTFRGVMYSFFSYPTRFVADRFFGCSVAAGVHRYGRRTASSSSFMVIQNAFDIEKFTYDIEVRNRVLAEFGLAENFVVGHVGRLNIMKNHRFLLKVFAALCEHVPEAKLLLVGEGEERIAIETQIQRLSMEDRVIMTGMRGDIEALLQAMDIFVFPSLAEGLGISLVEAQASGLPCIASDTVPAEAKVTDLVTFLSLHEEISCWVDAIREKRSVVRKGRIEEVRNAGYDIVSSARELEQVYLNTP
ncbi:MAG: glycosyltransferase family 1 protein, partial [Sphaerochaetaceae bacterium]|nr:glycosyltransferase family 1 protein [Sphaerochaetaceae bacterium]